MAKVTVGEVDEIGRRFRDANRHLQAAAAEYAVAVQNDGDVDHAARELSVALGAIDNLTRELCQLGTPFGPKPDEDYPVLLADEEKAESEQTADEEQEHAEKRPRRAARPKPVPARRAEHS